VNGTAEHLVLLVRHPQTEANIERRYAGTSESPYSALGEKQALELAHALAAWGPARVFTSPRLRTLDLAAAVAGGGSAVVLPELAEIDFGEAELMTYDEMAAAGLRVDYPGMEPLHGLQLAGETWEAFRLRIAGAAARVATDGGRTLVIAHGGVIRALLAEWFELTPTAMFRLEIANAGHALVAFSDDHPRLRSFGPNTLAALG
jgi:broad specificity phosphatase PhoE